MGEKKQYWMRSRLDIKVFHWYKEIVSYLSTAGGEASRRNTLHVGGHRGMERKKNVRMDHLDTRQKVLETHFSQPSKCRWHILSSYIWSRIVLKILLFTYYSCAQEKMYMCMDWWTLWNGYSKNNILHMHACAHMCLCVYKHVHTPLKWCQNIGKGHLKKLNTVSWS